MALISRYIAVIVISVIPILLGLLLLERITQASTEAEREIVAASYSFGVIISTLSNVLVVVVLHSKYLRK